MFDRAATDSMTHVAQVHALIPITALKTILKPSGAWITGLAIGILDDRSRLVCHVQLCWSEDTNDLVHGFSQTIQMPGLPRALTKPPHPSFRFRPGTLIAGPMGVAS